MRTVLSNSVKLWAVVLFLACSVCAQVSDPAFFERGLALYANGKMEQAEGALRQALASNPQDLRAADLLEVIRREGGLHGPALTPVPGLSVPQPVGTQQLLQLVLGRNAEIRKSVMRVVQSRAELRSARLDISPELSVLGRFYPLGIFASLTQSLFGGFFKRQAQIHQAEARLLSSLADYATVRDAVLDRAAGAWLEARRAQATVSALQPLVNAREEQRRVALVHFEQGTLPAQEQLATEQALEGARRQTAETTGRGALALATLNALMGAAADAPLTLAEERVPVDVSVDWREALSNAQKKRPEMEKALQDVRAAKAGRDVVLRELPTVDLRTTWGKSSEAGRGDFLTGPSVGMRATMPLLIVPIQRARSARERAIIRQMEFELARMSAETQLQALDAWESLVTARARLAESERQVRAAEETTRSAALVERWGERGDRLRILEAEALYCDARVRLIEADHSTQRAAFTLQRAMGTLTEHVRTEPAGAVEKEKAMAGAMWVYRPQFLDSADSLWVIDFAQSHGIGTLFLSASAKSLAERPESYRRFLQAAHARQIKVQALLGDAQWSLPGHRAGAERGLDAVIEFNRGGAAFDGIHLDVEPHTLPEWKAGGEERLAAEFVQLLQWAHRVTSAAGLPLAADIHPKLISVAAGGSPVIDQILGAVDEVAVMAYRDRPEKVIEAVRPILQRAQKQNKRVWAGISADRQHLGEAGDVAGLITGTGAALRGEKGFAGVAIHDLDRYRDFILSSGAGR